MNDKPRIVDLPNKHRDVLEEGLVTLARVAPPIAKMCRIHADALAAEGFTPKEICRILGAYLSQI